MRILLVLLFVVLVFGCGKPAPLPVSSQVTEAVAMPGVKVEEPQPAQVIEKNFDPSSKRLPERFVANDAWAVFDAFRDTVLEKGKYETTQEYNARIKEFGHRSILGEFRPGGSVIFEVTKGSDALKYDPDSGQMNLKLDCLIHGIEIDRKPVNMSDISTLEGSVSPVELSRRYPGSQALKMMFVDSFPDQCFSIVASAKMSRESARESEGKLFVYVVGKARPPYMQESIDYQLGGSPRSPIYVRKMPFTLSGIWIVNWQTGEILSKSYRVKRYLG